MNDEELLGYFELHSRTERALFSRDHIVRLSKLAGYPVKDVSRLPQFIAVHEPVAKPYIERARRRMKFRLIQGGKR